MAKAKTKAKPAKIRRPNSARYGGKPRQASATPVKVVAAKSGKSTKKRNVDARGRTIPSLAIYEEKWVEYDDVSPLKLNPKSRVKKLGNLPQSMDEYDQFLPIVVDPDMNMADGMRRYTAAGPEYLNWSKVKVMIVPYDLADLFRELNYNRSPLTAVAAIEIYLTGGRAKMYLSQRMRTILEELEEVCGLGIMNRMVKAGLSSSAFSTAKAAAKFLGDVRKPMVRRIMGYFITTQSSHSAQRRMSAKTITQAQFRSHMESGKQIQPTYKK